jgi:hypothetical protein
VRFGTFSPVVTFVSDTELSAAITSAMLPAVGQAIPVTVTNPSSGSASNPLDLTVLNPVPTIADVKPRAVPFDTTDGTVTLGGTGFVSTSTVQEGTTTLTPVTVTPTSLVVRVPNPTGRVGARTLTVRNPAPAGGTSNAVRLTFGGWQRQSPGGTAPPALSGHAVVSAFGRIYVFGGQAPNANGPSNELYSYSPATNAWIPITPRPPATLLPRTGHGMTYDAFNDRVVIVGGYGTDGSPNGGRFLNDVWTFDATINSTSPTAAPYREVLANNAQDTPVARYGHALTYDPARKQVLMFGGASAPTSGGPDGVWAWNGLGWRNYFTPPGNAGDAPRLDRAAFACDGDRNACILFGGDRGQEATNLTYLYTAANAIGGRLWFSPTSTPIFNPTATGTPETRMEACAFSDSLRGIYTVYGGRDNLGNYRNSTWDLDYTRWTPVRSASPPARHAMGCDFDAATAGGVGVMYGGNTSTGTPFNELWFHAPEADTSCVAPTRTGQSQTFVVEAASRSLSTPPLDTGITLARCQRIRIRVDPANTVTACRSFGQGNCTGPANANGVALHAFEEADVLCRPRLARCGALVAAVTSNPQASAPLESGVFLPGLDTTKVIREPGRLYFSIDDDLTSDNSGAFNVTVEY